ncbi:M56 family metallopeptidase [Clostridium culturomicium]|uniref:M56 family metallopeptidase n=1 Tax=Clostridium culturomicium TaxID=1499683 RepID=UPI000B08A317
MGGISINIVDLFENLINISLMGSVFALIIFCIRPIIKRFFGPMILSCLWLILIIKLIIPYGQQSELSIYNIPNKLSRKITSEDLQINHSTTDNSQTINNMNFEKIPSDSNITTYSPPIDTSLAIFL